MYLKRLYRAKNVSRRTYPNASTKFIFKRFWGSKTTIDIDTAKWGSKNRSPYMPSLKIKVYIFIKNARYINIFKILHECILFVYKKDNLKIDTDPHFLNAVFFLRSMSLNTMYREKSSVYRKKISFFPTLYLSCQIDIRY